MFMEENENLKKINIQKEIIAASKDPMFLNDIYEVEEDFRFADFK